MNEDENLIWKGIDARLDRLEDLVQELDASLRGDRRRKIVGLLSAWDQLDEDVRRIKGLVIGDVAGSNKGMAHDVDLLMGRRKYDNQAKEFRWKYWIPTLLALLALTVTILTSLDKIKENLPRYHPSPLEAKIDEAKHPKGKTLYRVRRVPAVAPSDDIKESPTNPPK